VSLRRAGAENGCIAGDEGYDIIIFGDRGHREVIGLEGYGQGRARIIQNVDEADDLPYSSKLGVVVQTTQEIDLYLELLSRLGKKCRELRAFNTICEATDSARTQQSNWLMKSI